MIDRRTIPSFALALLLSSVSLPGVAQPRELPPTPDGFHWERVDEVKAALLVPNNWHFKREKHETTLGFFATRENIDNGGEFLVGLTVNVIPDIKGQDAVQYAKTFIAGFPEGKKLLKSWDASTGPFVGGGCLVEDKTTVMHTFMIANAKTNTLYLFIFEAPKEEWDAAWRIGQEMVRCMLLDDEV
jgi:hypothetical protein